MKLFLCLLFMIPLATNCGSEQKVYKKPRTSSAYAYQSTIDDNCNKCHSFKGPLNSAQKNRVSNGSMPPNGGLSDEDKEILLK